MGTKGVSGGAGSRGLFSTNCRAINYVYNAWLQNSAQSNTAMLINQRLSGERTKVSPLTAHVCVYVCKVKV